MKEPAAVTPEFSRPLPADSVGPQPLLRRIEAGPAEREGLAKRFDLLALDRLEASLELSRGKGEVIRLQGAFHRRCGAELRRHPRAGAGPSRGRFRDELQRLGRGTGRGRSGSAGRGGPGADPRGASSTWGKPWPSSSPLRWIPIRGPPAPAWRLWRRRRRWRGRGHGTPSPSSLPSRKRRPARNRRRPSRISGQGAPATSELPGTSNSAKQRSPSVPGLPCCAGIGCALRGTIQGRLTSWRFQRRRCRSPVATCGVRTMAWRPSNRSNARTVAS